MDTTGAGAKVREIMTQAAAMAGGLNALGRLIGVNGSSVLAWTRGEAVPGLDKVPVLAVLLRENQDIMRAMIVAALEERAVRRRMAPVPRPTMGGRRLGSLSPVSSTSPAGSKLRSRVRRAKKALGAIALAVLSGLGSAQAQPLDVGGGHAPSYRTFRPRRLAVCLA